MPEVFLDKVINFSKEPVVEYDVPVLKNTFIEDSDIQNRHKKTLIGILNVLFLETTLFIVLVS